MRSVRRLGSWLGAVAAFVGAAVFSAGCVATCKGVCDNFDPEISIGTYSISVPGTGAVDHFAVELSEVEITEEQVILRYVDLNADPAEVVWDIVEVESP